MTHLQRSLPQDLGTNAQHLRWLDHAIQLQGKSPVAIALMLLIQNARLGSPNFILLTPATLREFGMNRSTVFRALRSLEEMGLVTVRRTQGSSLLVTILHPSFEQRAC